MTSFTKTIHCQNIVLVTPQHFTVQNLINNTNIIQSIVFLNNTGIAKREWLRSHNQPEAEDEE